jgi:hypothetical protein
MTGTPLQQLRQAYEALHDPVKRAAYDAQCIDLPASAIAETVPPSFRRVE